MITLYCYPELFGLPDNNPYGLKVYAFLKLTKIPFRVEHVMDTKLAPRGQLPYLVDQNQIISPSNKIISYLIKTYQLSIDDDLTSTQKNTDLLVRSMLDEHMYWIMSYSRWQDPQNWPHFKKEFMKSYPQVSVEDLENAKAYNLQRYYAQGIGRYEPEEIYDMGIANLNIIYELLNAQKFMFGNHPHTIDACVYGYLANIYYFDIKTPLKAFILSKDNLVDYCKRMHDLILFL